MSRLLPLGQGEGSQREVEKNKIPDITIISLLQSHTVQSDLYAVV